VKNLLSYSLLVIVSLSSLSGPHALAQSENLALEEVVVTARRRAESLQDAPLAVTAITGDSLRDAGITNLADITELVPNVQINRPSRDANVYIRGVGPARGATNVTELSVGVYIDDVFMLKPHGQMIDLAEIESVQVLRGPQGTLFGKNTTGGAMVVTTVKPAEEFGGYAQITVGNDDRLNGQVSVDVPLSERWLSKLTVTSVKIDGFFRDPVHGTELSDEDRLGAALQLRWLASDDVTADFSFYQNKIRENHLAMGDCVVTNREAQIPGNKLITPKSGFKLISDFCEDANKIYDGRSPYDSTQRFTVDSSQASMNIVWDINENHRMKSITSWRYQETPNIGTTNTYAGFPHDQASIEDGESTQVSQEFQFNGELMDGGLSYSAGLFFMQDDSDTGTRKTFLGVDGIIGSVRDDVPDGLVAGAVNYNELGQETDNTTYAIYSQWSWDATENLELTAGLRYGYEQRDIEAFRTNAADPWDAFAGIPGVSIIPGVTALMSYDTFFNELADAALPLLLQDTVELEDDKSFESLTPMVSAAYSLPESMLADGFDALMFYASYTEGYKAGGFSDFNLGVLIPYEEEEITNIELGMKMDAWDNRLRVNAAVFTMDYDEMQLFVARPSPDPNDVGAYLGVTNAGASSIDGVELEVSLLPAEGWLINFAASWASGEFDEFDDFITDPETREPILLDRSDEDLPSLPESTYSLGVQYDWTTGFGDWTARVDTYYRDELYWGFDYLTWQLPLARENSTSTSYTLYNARLSWQVNDKLSLTAWGKNIGDKTYGDGGVGEAANIGHVVKSLADILLENSVVLIKQVARVQVELPPVLRRKITQSQMV
jgi:iron complex outermembrane receptor protein